MIEGGFSLSIMTYLTTTRFLKRVIFEILIHHDWALSRGQAWAIATGERRRGVGATTPSTASLAELCLHYDAGCYIGTLDITAGRIAL